MSITVHDKELPELLRIILADSEPEPYLRYRLRQRIEARLHELDPTYTGPLGPAWTVWITEPLGEAISGDERIWSEWGVHEEFSFLEDPDGAKARAAAHAMARDLRTTYHCSYVAVTPATREPLPLKLDPS